MRFFCFRNQSPCFSGGSRREEKNVRALFSRTDMKIVAELGRVLVVVVDVLEDLEAVGVDHELTLLGVGGHQNGAQSVDGVHDLECRILH